MHIRLAALRSPHSSPLSFPSLMQDAAVSCRADGREKQRTADDRRSDSLLRGPGAAVQGDGPRRTCCKRPSASSACRTSAIDRGGQRARRSSRARRRVRVSWSPRTSTPSFPKAPTSRSRATGDVLRGPGIGDNCRGLAVLVAVVAVAEGGAACRRPGRSPSSPTSARKGSAICAAMKALFNETMKGQIDRFVSIDGAGLHVTHIAVGSHRYRVTFKGPGGHSFARFRTAESGERARPRDGEDRRISGAEPAEDDVQRRPHRRRHLGERDPVRGVDGGRPAVVGSANAGGARRRSFNGPWIDAGVPRKTRGGSRAGQITVTKELVGDRPAGSTSTTSPIVQTAQAAARALGLGTRCHSAKARPTRTSR